MAGHWNRRIFSPAWVTSRLTTAKEVAIEVPVDNPGLPVRFAFDNIHLSVAQGQLILTVDRPEDMLLEKCREVAIKALAELPHTPIMGVGVNYQFIAEQPDESLLRVFHLPDNDCLSDAGIRIISTVIQRSLLIQDQMVNLYLSLTGNTVQVTFNFHKDTPSSDDAIAFLKAHSTDLKEKAINLLSSIYNSAVETMTVTV